VILDELLTLMQKRKASDLHLREGRPPLMRVGGDILPTEHAPLHAESLWNLLAPTMNESLVGKLEEEREVDLSYEVPGVARFRFNIFYARAKIGAVIRLIPVDVPTIDGLGMPAVLKDLSSKPHGIFLVTGPTGSGKSTTLAACVEHINRTRHCHIITVEDPIEFVYTDQKAVITQRALGRDSLSHKHALRAALRQDPDVILAGEMRDRETMELAIHAAETGHLVLSTLHTNDAKQTIDRILDSFPPEAQKGLRRMLSVTLIGVVCQRLIKHASGSGRVPAMEIMINSPAIRELINKGDTAGVGKAIQSSQSYYRMQSFNQHLAKLVSERKITTEDALANSGEPDDLKLLLRGLGRTDSFNHSGEEPSGTASFKRGGGGEAAAKSAPQSPPGRSDKRRVPPPPPGRKGRPQQRPPGDQPKTTGRFGSAARRSNIKRGFEFG